MTEKPQKVFKYPLPVDDEVAVKMPKGAEILYVNAQGDIPCVWARVHPDAPLTTRRFRVAGTGHPLGAHVGRHLGSFFMRDGALVFHLFEIVS